MELNDVAKDLNEYERFVQAISARLVTYLKMDKDDPDYISQNRAFKIFGRGNVGRWVKQGLVSPNRKGGKIEYRTALLNELRRTPIDYYDSIPKELERVAKRFK